FTTNKPFPHQVTCRLSYVYKPEYLQRTQSSQKHLLDSASILFKVLCERIRVSHSFAEPVLSNPHHVQIRGTGDL
ncbi:MAG: hypothetical protein QW123_04890, partial [Desulfurococcaceae archaeon]